MFINKDIWLEISLFLNSTNKKNIALVSKDSFLGNDLTYKKPYQALVKEFNNKNLTEKFKEIIKHDFAALIGSDPKHVIIPSWRFQYYYFKKLMKLNSYCWMIENMNEIFTKLKYFPKSNGVNSSIYFIANLVYPKIHTDAPKTTINVDTSLEPTSDYLKALSLHCNHIETIKIIRNIASVCYKYNTKLMLFQGTLFGLLSYMNKGLFKDHLNDHRLESIQSKYKIFAYVIIYLIFIKKLTDPNYLYQNSKAIRTIERYMEENQKDFIDSIVSKLIMDINNLIFSHDFIFKKNENESNFFYMENNQKKCKKMPGAVKKMVLFCQKLSRNKHASINSYNEIYDFIHSLIKKQMKKTGIFHKTTINFYDNLSEFLALSNKELSCFFDSEYLKLEVNEKQHRCSLQ